MSIRPSHHNFAGNTQNTPATRMQKMRERFNRWEHQANQRKSMFIERQKARVERYRNAFRGSWISKIGLGLVALWNFITNPPFVVSIEKRATVPFTAMLPFGLNFAKNDKNKKKRGSSKRVRTTRNRLSPETLEQRQLLAGDLYVDAPADFQETTNVVAGTLGTIEDGDIVTWGGPDGNVGTGGDNETGLTFGSVVSDEGAFGTIQDAINAASAGDTIHLAPGTYSEDLTINSTKTGLTIVGANSGVAGDGTRGAESTIDGYIKIDAADVELDGVEVLNGGAVSGSKAGVYVQAANVTVTNSILTGDGTGAAAGIGVEAVITSGVSDGLTVSNSVVEDWNMGVYVQGANNDATITGNTIRDNFHAGVGADGNYAGSQVLTLTGNDFSGNGLDVDAFGNTPNNYGAGSDVSGNSFTSPTTLGSADLPSGVVTGNISSVVTTIQAAVDAAFDGDTISVAAGTYVEDLVLNKQVAIVGAGEGLTIIQGTTGQTVSVTADNVSLQDLTVEGATGVDGVVVNGADGTTLANVTLAGSSSAGDTALLLEGAIDGVTLVNVDITGNAIGLQVGATATVNDLAVDSASSFSGNLYDVYMYSLPGQNGSLSNSTFGDGSGSLTMSGADRSVYLQGLLTDVSFDTVAIVTTGENSATNAGLSSFEIRAVNGTSTGVSLSGTVNNGMSLSPAVYLRARPDTVTPANAGKLEGTILANLTVTGGSSNLAVRDDAADGLSIASSVTLDGGLGTPLGNVFIDVTTGPVDLGDVQLVQPNPLAAFIVNSSSSAVDATGVAFNNGGALNPAGDISQAFAVEDKILHAVDVAILGVATPYSVGLVRVVANNVYITTDSYYAAAGTTEPSVQRAVDAATAGDTVNVAAGTYAAVAGVQVTKDVTIKGATGTASDVILQGSLVTDDVINVATTGVSSLTISDLTVENAGTRHGIRAAQLAAPMSLTIDNVISQNNTRWGVAVSGPVTLAITDSVFSGNADGGVGTYSGVIAATVSGSDFTGQTGVQVNNNTGSGMTVNASGNYFGTTSPASVTTSGNVDYTPMLNAAPTGTSTDFDSLIVHASGQQVGGGRIAEGQSLLNASGTLQVRGGTYGEDVNVDDYTYSPGASPAINTVGSYTQTSGGTTLLELDGTAAGAEYDQIKVDIVAAGAGTGTVSLDGSLSLDFGYVPSPGDSWTLIDNDGTDVITTEFSSHSAGDFTVVLPGGASVPLTIDYAGGDGNDVVLSVASYSTLYAASTQAGGVDRAFTVTNDPGSDGFSVGDTVTFTPVAGTPVPGLIVGYQAFASMDAAIESATAGTVIQSAGWVVNEDTAGGVNISLNGGADLDGVTYSLTPSVGGTGAFQGQLGINVDQTVKYTPLPPANFDGNVKFTYTVKDASSPATIAGTVFVDVLPVNDAPVLSAIEGSTFSFAEGDAATQITNTIVATDIDDAQLESATVQITTNFEAGDVLSVTGLPAGVTSSFSGDTLTITGAASVAQYQAILRAVKFENTSEKPTENTRTISFSVSDGDVASLAQTRGVEVDEINDSPTPAADTATVDEDSSVSKDVLANDTDLDDLYSAGEFSLASVGSATASDARVIPGAAITSTSAGVITFNAAGLFEDLDTGESVTVTIPYTMQDDDGATSSSTLEVTVTGVNDGPTATDDSTTTDEDTSVTKNVLANDDDAPNADPDDDVADFVLSGLGAATASDSTTIPGSAFNFTANGDVTFDPSGLFDHLDTGESVTVTIPYTMNDGGGESSTAELEITITGVNDPVVANPNAYSVAEEGTLTGNVITDAPSDTDPDDTPVIVGSVAPAHALSFSVASNGAFTYVPVEDFVGSDSFTYFVSDGDSTSSAVVSITVTAVNDAPEFTVPTASAVLEDSADAVDVPFLAGISAGATNESGQTVSFAVVASDPTLFDVQPTINANGELSYELADDAFGSTTLTITATDTGGTPGVDNAVDSYTFEVKPVNDEPTLTVSSVVSVLENSTAQSVPGFATPTSGAANETQTFTYEILSNDNAALFSTSPAIAPDGTLTFEPAAHAFGSAIIEVNVKDSGGVSDGGDDTSATETFTITISPVNDAPVATNDTFVLEEDDSPFSLDVIGNVTPNGADDAGQPNESAQDLTIVSFSLVPGYPSGVFGNLAINPSGKTFDFTPAANFNGSFEFTYTIRDNGSPNLDSNEATVSVTVNPENDTPTVENPIGDVSVNEDAVDTTIDLSTVFDDVDILTNGDSLTYTTSSSDGSLVAATISGAGTDLVLDYQPEQNGTATITVRATDSTGLFVEDTFEVVVAELNDAPTVANQLSDVSVLEDAASTTLDLSGVFGDVDILTNNDSLTYTASSSDGSLVTTAISVSGTDLILDYQPEQNGTATITVRATDAAGLFVEDTFEVEVAAENDEPTVVAGLADVVVNEDAADSTVDLSNVFDDVDILTNSDSLTYTASSSDGSLVTAAISVSGTDLILDYQPDQNGTATITVRATDTAGDFVEDSFLVTVNPVNDTPTASDIAFAVGEGQTFVFDLAPFVDDVETPDSGLIYTLVSGPSTGTLTAPSGSSVWTFVAPPSPSITTGIVVEYEVSDGAATSAVHTITIDIVDINDPPVVTDDTGVAGENETKSFDVLANDTDPDAPSDVPANFILDSLGTVTVSGVPSLGGASFNIVGNQIAFNPGTAFDSLDAGDTATVTVPYTMTDDEGLSDSGELVITVNGTNDTPTAVADTKTIDENEDTTVAVLANDTDADDSDSAINFTLVSPLGVATSTGGFDLSDSTISIDGDSIKFEPGTEFDSLDPGDSVEVTIPYTMEDTAGAQSSSTLVITINGADDGPIANDDDSSYTTDENDALTVDVLANDEVVDDDDLTSSLTVSDPTVVSVSGPSGVTLGNGTVNVVGNEVVFTPGTSFDTLDAGESATVEIEYTANLGALQDTATLTVTVNGVNDAPVGVAETYATSEETTLVVPAATGVLQNDTDVDDKYGSKNDLSVNLPLVTQPTKGSIIMAANGAFNYTPFANQNGQDSFVYRVKDNSGALSAPVTVLINIAATNDAPVAVADSGTTDQDTQLTVDVVANDTDVDSPTLTLQSASITATAGLSGSPAVAGTVSVSGNEVTFDPGTAFAELDAGDSATVTVSYTVSDGFSPTPGTATGTLTITVTGLADDPTAMNDTGASLTEDAPSVLVDVLANDTDVDGDDSPTNFVLDSVAIDSVSTPTGVSITNSGSASIDSNQLKFTPSSDYQQLALGEAATVVVNYTMKDAAGNTSSAQATIEVTGVNDAPTTSAGGARTTLEDTAIVGDVGITATDTDSNDTLEYVVVSAPANALSFTLNPATGSFDYTPAANFNGTDGFVYKVNDGTADSVPQAVVLNVTAVNDPPVFTPATLNDVTVLQNVGAYEAAAFLTVEPGPANESGQSITTFTVVADDPSLFTAGPAIDSSGKLTFTPDGSMSGTTTVTVTAVDNAGGADTSDIEFDITVDEFDFPTLAADVTLGDSDEDEAVTITAAQLLANSSDPDDALSVTSVSLISGAGSLSGTGPWTFTPDDDESGPVEIEFSVQGGTLEGPVTASFNVLPVNDPPEITVPLTGVAVDEASSVGLETLVSVDDIDINDGVSPGTLTVVVTLPAGGVEFEQLAGPSGGTIVLSGSNKIATFSGEMGDVQANLALVQININDVDPGAALTETLTVTVTASDAGATGNVGVAGNSSTASFDLEGTDAGPTITLAGAATHDESSTVAYTLTLSGLTDPAGLVADPITGGTVYFGDFPAASEYELTAAEIVALNGSGSITVDHLYEDDAWVTNPIRVALESQGNAAVFQSAGTMPITVNNVAPTASVSANGPFNEGDTGGQVNLTNIFDPSGPDAANLRYSYDFNNDGLFEIEDSTSSTVSIPDSFLADNLPAFLAINKEIKVVVKDDELGQNSYTIPYVVNNVDPTIVQPIDGLVQAGDLFSRNVTFNDPGADTWDAVVDFGDGSPAVNYTGVSKTFAISHTFATVGAKTVSVTVTDDDGASDVKTFTVNVTAVPASVAGRHVFYNRSVFDGTPIGSASDGANDDAAIATDKVALLPGASATAANYTNYLRGINGVMVDIANLPATSLTASDFEFRVGNTADPTSWTLLDAGQQPTIEVRAGEGSGGSDRIELIWADEAIKNQWLQVTVKANASTGLLAPDVHYWGNQVGETENVPGNTVVDNGDLNSVFLEKGPAAVGVENNFDINRDGVIDNGDLFGVFFNKTGSLPGDSLLLFTPPTPMVPVMMPSSSASVVDSVFAEVDDDDLLVDGMLF
ncbi:tandem-95 repeat protein [Rhodopirellula sp. P2]|uniref:tandem-95 repeat protein n=1 Tax=Rhodopirellula sp. P2 TaxID=2127060 RepID=UPI002367900C|nr:Ig-like domain-containing protein [Rhodopirellula sp. P2]WDQ16955.1 Ig-like domain-containing protein [Rhodopirellula sp. P2]